MRWIFLTLCVMLTLPMTAQKTIEKWDNGQVKSEGKMKAGKEHGKWLYYTEKGEKQEQRCYKKGMLHKTLIRWYENGNLRAKVKYKNGIQIKETRYHKNGKKQEQGEYYVDENGYKKHGVWKYWRENGSLEYKMTYDKGRIIKDEPFLQ